MNDELLKSLSDLIDHSEKIVKAIDQNTYEDYGDRNVSFVSGFICKEKDFQNLLSSIKQVKELTKAD